MCVWESVCQVNFTPRYPAIKCRSLITPKRLYLIHKIRFFFYIFYCLNQDFHPVQIRFLQNRFLIFHTENSSWPQTSPKNLLDTLTQDPRAWWRLNCRSVLSRAHRNGNLNSVCRESHSFARTVYGENNSKRQNSESKGGWERERPSSFIRSVGVKSTVNNTVWFMASAPLYESPYCDWDSFWPVACFLSRLFIARIMTPTTIILTSNLCSKGPSMEIVVRVCSDFLLYRDVCWVD